MTYRRSTVRKRLFAHGRGFLCVNDGAEFASQLARYLAVMLKATPQSSEMVAVGSLRAAVDQN